MSSFRKLFYLLFWDMALFSMFSSHTHTTSSPKPMGTDYEVALASVNIFLFPCHCPILQHYLLLPFSLAVVPLTLDYLTSFSSTLQRAILWIQWNLTKKDTESQFKHHAPCCPSFHLLFALQNLCNSSVVIIAAFCCVSSWNCVFH